MRLLSLPAALLLIVCPQICSAALVDSVLVVRRGHVVGGPFECHGCFSPGDEFLFLGLVEHVGAPLLLAPDAGEFTIRISDAVCEQVGLWDDLPTNSGGAWVVLTPSIVEVYRDASPDADATNPETYWDGELILYARVDGIELFFDHSGYQRGIPVKSEMHFRAGGGMWFHRVSKDGLGYSGHLTVGCGHTLDSNELVQRGIMGYFTALISLDAPVAVDRTSWGRLKLLYQ